MAIQTKTHAKRLGVLNHLHLVNLAMALIAGHPAVHMDGMVEINVVGNLVNLHPRDWRVVGRAVADDLQSRIIFEHLIMAVHAGGRAGQIGEPRFFHAVVAVTAVHAKLARVNLMRKGHRLDGLVTGTGVFGREINRDGRHDGSTTEHGDQAEHQRQTICPFRKNHAFQKLNPLPVRSRPANFKIERVF